MDDDARLQQFLDVFRMFCEVSMTWWVSATALCGAMIAGVWLKRQDVTRAGSWAVHGAGILGAVFIGSIVLFGGILTYRAHGMRAELSSLCANDPRCEQAFGSFVAATTPAIAVGTSSFVVAFVTWMFLWHGLVRGRDTERATSSPIAAAQRMPTTAHPLATGVPEQHVPRATGARPDC